MLAKISPRIEETWNRKLDIPEYSMKERKTKTSILQKLTSREDEISQKQARAILL